jgi:hypothetical protein
MELNYEIQLGKCEIVDNTQYLNQKKCDILKRIILAEIYKISPEIINQWKFFNYEYGLNRETNCIESLVLFNAFDNELDYFYFSPIPIILLFGKFYRIESFVSAIKPLIEKDIIELHKQNENKSI